MDENKLQATLHALEWEARYRKRAAGQDTGNAFLKEIEGLDADFAEALSRFGLRRGRLLEIGAGLGDQAVQYALMGFEVTATKVSDTALAQGSSLASRHGVAVSFVNDNILFTRLEGEFDVIADRGCYTIQPKDFLGHYARNTARLLAPDGYLLLKVDKKTRTSSRPCRGISRCWIVRAAITARVTGKRGKGFPTMPCSLCSSAGL